MNCVAKKKRKDWQGKEKQQDEEEKKSWKQRPNESENSLQSLVECKLGAGELCQVHNKHEVMQHCAWVNLKPRKKKKKGERKVEGSEAGR